jgi:hypothetical protein
VANEEHHCGGHYDRRTFCWLVRKLHCCRIVGPEVCRGGILQGRRPEGATDDVQPVSNARELEKQPTNERRPLIPVEYGPIVGAVITAAASLLLYSFQQIRHIDERLDSLEQEARVLLNSQGSIKPSKEAMQNFFHIEAILRRLDRLEKE